MLNVFDISVIAIIIIIIIIDFFFGGGRAGMINSMIIRCCFRSTALFSKCLPCLHPMDKYELLVISLGRWDKEQNRRYALIISSYRYFR